MRVISGSARGRRLVSLDGDYTRPTTDRVKESVFNIIMPCIADSVMLDLFAGSGALGIEGLSRGAAKAVFVENSADAVKIVKTNVLNTHLSDRAVFYKGDFKDYLTSSAEKFDIVFLDPPYNSGFYEPALLLIRERGLLKSGGLAVIERQHDIPLPEIDGFRIYTDRKYGKTSITVLEKD